MGRGRSARRLSSCLAQLAQSSSHASSWHGLSTSSAARQLHASASACEKAVSASILGVPGSVRSSGVAPPTPRPATAPFLSFLQGSAARTITTPLSEPLPGLPSAPRPARRSTPPPTEITVLPNGVHILSEAATGPTASMGMYINAGSIHEGPGNSGATAMLECLSFRSTHHRTSTDIMAQVERAGAHISAVASREQLSYTTDCLRSCLAPTLELLCDAVLNPAFVPDEVNEQKARLQLLLQQKEVALSLLTEMLVRNAYTGALSHPLIPDAPALARLTPDAIASFHARHCTGSRLVLAASGVDHQQLVELATPMLSQAPRGSVPEEPSSSYQGGHVALPPSGPPDPNSPPLSNLVVAWEFAGGWRDVQGAVAMTVLTYLMGGGQSFSSGGPGKGMHSRLYTRVLNQYAWVHGCQSSNATFNTSGLFGIQASCIQGNELAMVDVMCREMELAARSLTAVEVERAKCAALASIANALESKATSAEDIGRQWLTYGKRISGREYAQLIQAVTPRDINRFVNSLLDSRPSLATHGAQDVSYDTLLRRYAPKLQPQQQAMTPGGGGAWPLQQAGPQSHIHPSWAAAGYTANGSSTGNSDHNGTDSGFLQNLFSGWRAKQS